MSEPSSPQPGVSPVPDADLIDQVNRAFDPDDCLIDLTSGAPTVKDTSTHLLRATAPEGAAMAAITTTKLDLATEVQKIAAAEKANGRDGQLLSAVATVAARTGASFDDVMDAVMGAVRQEMYQAK